MNRIRIFAVLSTVAMGAVFTASAHADGDVWNKLTKVTISEPIAVSGTVLQPGSYWFKLVDLPSTRHSVQIVSENREHVFATVNTNNVYRNQPTDKTVFTFYETPAGQPPAVKDWFYPGDDYGQQFVNRGGPVQVSQISQAAVQTRPVEPAPVPVVSAEPAPAAPPEAASTEPAQNEQIAQNEPPAAAPPAPEQAPGDSSAPAVLPKTASDTPLLTLFGLLSLGAAAGLGKVVKKVG
jgi:LPXTG-motif cell wall-anchored protein